MLQAQESQARIAANNECLRQNQKPDVIPPSAERLRERSAHTQAHIHKTENNLNTIILRNTQISKYYMQNIA